MKIRKTTAKLMAFLLAVCMLATTALAYDGIYTDKEGNISYSPYEQGLYSNGGYTIDKVSHPTLGAGEVDGILTGDLQDRGQSYSWSMAEAGDYVYIGTCYNSTYYIYHNNVKTTLDGMKSSGILDPELDTGKVADEIVQVAFGVDTFDSTLMNDWAPVIMAVHKITGEAKVIFRERDVWSQHPDIFPGYAPTMAVKNYLSGYRMAFEFQGKLYFAGMGNPTATLVEVDPVTNEAKIVYYNINQTRGVANGVHGLLVYDGEILMCLATDNYDGKGTPGGLIVASSNPSASLDTWRVIADQDDFDGLPAVMQIDGLNGGGVWDIIEYHDHLYVTVVTDKTDKDTGVTNKQGFAMYRGEKQADGSFTWTQVIGDHSKYGFGLGINYSMACNMWVYDGYLYLGTYNDPMLDLAAVTATGNFEHLYNDLDHSIYLYRMDAEENFQQIGGKDDNPYFPEGPLGNLGAGLGNHSNQYVWRFGVHNDELYLGTFDTSTLTYMFTQLTDGQVANMDYEDISGRAELLEDALLQVLGQENNPYLAMFLEATLFHTKALDLFRDLSGFATDMSADWNPVPDYRELLENYEAFRDDLLARLESQMAQPDFLEQYAAANGVTVAELLVSQGAEVQGPVGDRLKAALREQLKKLLASCDQVFYDSTIHNFVFYFGVNYYAQECERGFDLLVSNDGVHFDAITRDGFGDGANHGLRTICSTKQGVFLGTANPYYGTQLWRMYSERDHAGCTGGDGCPSRSFTDLNTGVWYHPYTDYVISHSLMRGLSSTLFAPNQSMTRGMMVTTLYRLAGEPQVEGTATFQDVKSSAYYANAVAWAEANGIAKGIDTGVFAPNAPVTREQAAAFAYRYVTAYLGKTPAPGASLGGFQDAGLVSDYAAESLSWAHAAGLMVGYGDGFLGPKDTVTRAQMAKLLTLLAQNF